MNLRDLIDRIGLSSRCCVLVSPAVLFFLWMLSLSLKNEIDNIAYPPIFIPDRTSTWTNYIGGLRAPTTSRSISATASSSPAWRRCSPSLVGVPAGYGIAHEGDQGVDRRPDRAHDARPLLPHSALPRCSSGSACIGTLWPLIITHLVITVPIVVWIMIGYFETTADGIGGGGLIDGANLWQVFRHVALPLAKPGIVVALILAFIFSWNNFVFGIVLASRETRTLPVAVYNMLTFEQLSWGPLAAAALIVTLPVLLLTIAAQRQIVAGLTAGAVKGG